MKLNVNTADKHVQFVTVYTDRYIYASFHCIALETRMTLNLTAPLILDDEISPPS